MVAGLSDSEAEILRLRERCHTLENNYEAIRLLTTDNRERIGRVEKVLDDIVTKDAIAEAIAKRVNKERTVVLTSGQRFLFALVAIFTIYADIKGLTH